MSEALDQTREQHRAARDQFAQSERELTETLLFEIDEQIKSDRHGLAEARLLVREIPSQPSLDHSAAKREAIKELEEIDRRLRKLQENLKKFGGAG